LYHARPIAIFTNDIVRLAVVWIITPVIKREIGSGLDECGNWLLLDGNAAGD